MKRIVMLALALSFAVPLAAVAAPQANEFQQSYPTSNINNVIYANQSTGR